MKTVVTISKYWNNPKIMTVIWNNGISLTIGLEDFIMALKIEIPSITWKFSNKKFKKSLEKTIKDILEKIKEESIKVV